MSQRKKLKSEINGIDRIRDLYLYRKDIFIDNSSKSEYDKMLDYLNTILSNLKDKHHKSPIGHRYTGIFYLRKLNYDQTVESIKLNGTAFMREDLVSWTVDADNEYAKSLNYVREIYRDKTFKETIKRVECEAVFDSNKDINI